MIVTLHVATGALAGTLLGNRGAALAAGPVLHLAGDLVPHEDFPSTRFEVASGSALVLALAARFGLSSPAVVGALAACLPDVEHLVRLPRPGGRKLFPSHRVEGWHRSGGISAPAQLALALALTGLLLAGGARRR